jgi:outer membrane protein TolC
MTLDRLSRTTHRIGTQSRWRSRAASVAIVCFVAACAADSAAQQPPAIALTVEDAVSRAVAHSHRLAEIRAREEGSRASIETRRAAERPTVSVSGGYTRTNHVDEFGVPQPDGRLRLIYPDIPDNYFARAAVQWPIYTGGRTDALIRAAEAESRASADDLLVALADLRLEVVRAYWALVTASESVRVVDEGLARADAHLRDVRARFENGLIPPNEVASVEAQRARQQLQSIEAKNLRASVLEDLRRLTGIDVDITPAESLEASTHGAGPGPAPDRAARAELSALEQRIAAADERVSAVEAGRKPALSLTGGVDYANPNPRIFPREDRWRTSWDLGIVASWNVWDGGRVEAESAEASAQARALRARQQELRSLIDTDIRQRQLDVQSAYASLDAATAAVTSAAEARRVVSERFNVGVATSTDVLDAHVVLLQAELERTRALASIRLADARLERAVGR